MRSVIVTSLTAFSLISLPGCERYALDRQMEELCKKDGGITVYETVVLPASEFGPSGEPLFKYRALAKSRSDIFGPNYKYIVTREIVAGIDANPENGSGQLVRLHWTIHRPADGKLLGEQVEYRRNGGDLFTFGFQPSSASCPTVDRDIAQLIFIKGE